MLDQTKGSIFSANPDHRLTYKDASFNTLFARLLVFFGVYGIADHSLLDPIISEMYTEMLFARNRKSSKYSNLWSESNIEIFSTFRAIQTLSFYHLYQKGKEAKEITNKNQSPIDFFRATIQQLGESNINSHHNSDTDDDDDDEEEIEDPLFEPDNFKSYYCAKNKEGWPTAIDDEQTTHLKRFETFGNGVIKAINDRKIKKEIGSKLVDQMVSFVEKPWNKNGKFLHQTKMEGLEESYGNNIEL